MKSIIKQIQYFSGLLILFSACNDYDWDVDHTTKLTSFSQVTGPEATIMTVNYRDSVNTNNVVYDEGETFIFAWDRVKTADYSKVFYELQFFLNEDQNEPSYISRTGNNKINNSFSVTERDWNSIVEIIGVPQNTEENIYWRVKASNGINSETSTLKKIRVKRPEGFARLPNELYLTGTANNSGQGFSSGISFNKLNNLIISPSGDRKYMANGQYNTFVYLVDGRFNIQEKIDGTTLYRSFYISEDGQLKEIMPSQELIQNKPIAPNTMHQVWLDFKNQTGEIRAIKSVDLYYYGSNSVIGTFSQPNKNEAFWILPLYLELSGSTISKHKYKFRVTSLDATSKEEYSYWGSFDKTATNQVANSPAYYYYLNMVDDSSDYCFKLRSSGHDKVNVTFNLDLRTETAIYTHNIIIQ